MKQTQPIFNEINKLFFIVLFSMFFFTCEKNSEFENHQVEVKDEEEEIAQEQEQEEEEECFGK